MGSRWVAPPSVAEFYAMLPAVLQHELDVQRFEMAALGQEDIDDLRSHRLRRRKRIDEDAAHFRSRASLFSLRPRALPTQIDISSAAAEGRAFSALELTLLSSIDTVYIEITRPRQLELIEEHNTTFLTEINWARRDLAVNLRDTLMEKLTRFEPVLHTTWEILKGEVDEPALQDLLDALIELAPGADIGLGNLSELVLTDDVVREQVIEEMREELDKLDHRFVPLEPEGELRERMTNAQTTLLKRSDLVHVLVEDGELSQESVALEAKLVDKGVNAIDPVERAQLLQRRSEISVRRKQLQAQWRNTPPAQPYADEFMDAQDALLRRRLATLGTRGALFAQRYIALGDERAELDPEVPSATWEFLMAQAALSEDAVAAVPPPDPRAGLDLTPKVLLDPATRSKQQQLINLLKKATASKAKSKAASPFDELGPLPKPRKTKGKKP
ncbi:MAG: hypothetical protein DHS20C15_14200 [Planctomycetota bacterium]|nr:MAG: hypothetical protein DHS20C15_14200 [Planctomycetota bacterium]